MPKSNFIPTSDHDFLVWVEHFIANLKPEHGVTDSDLEALRNVTSDFRAKATHANDTAAAAKQATSDKNNSRQTTESLTLQRNLAIYPLILRYLSAILI